MSGFMLMAGCTAVVIGLATYPDRWFALVFVGAVLALLVRDLVQAGAGDPAELREERDRSDS